MDKDKELSDDVLITYRGEHDEELSQWVKLLDFQPTFVKFKTAGNNTIIISMSRLIRIKRRGE